MKLTLSLLLFTVVSFATESYSQSTRFNLKMKNATIVEIFQELERTSEFGFLFKNEQLDLKKRYTLNLHDVKIDEVLEEIVEKGSTYKIIGKNIIIIKNANLNTQQQKSVSGQVLDSSGSPLPGVTVVIKGTTQGTVTNADGNYSISKVSNEATLVFSFVGMKTQEIPVVGQSKINIIMVNAAFGLEEVVAIGYGTIKKRDLTGSVSGVSSDELSAVPLLRADDALQGRAAGVQVVKVNGAPGDSYKIRIRGSNSINGSNEPLYVIDGFIGGSLREVNIGDIESIDILKDASSTAIYGSRGANGVVIITTKRSSTEESKISLNAFKSFSSVRKKMDLLNAVEFAETVNAQRIAFGGEAVFSQNELSAFKSGAVGTDWQDEIFRNAIESNYELSISGGNKKSKYYISGGYINQKGVITNTDFEKLSLRVNLDTQLSKKVKLSLNVYGNRSKSRNIRVLGSLDTPVAAAVAFAPTANVYDEAGNYTLTSAYGSIGTNPLWIANERNRDDTRNLIKSNAKIDYEIIEGLTFSVLGGFSISNGPSAYFYSMRPGEEISKASGGISNSESVSWQNSNILTYEKKIGDKHKITATAIYEQQQSSGLSSGAASQKYKNISLGYYDLSLGSTRTATSGYIERSLQSYVGRLNYVFSDKYLFTATFRADGSSKFRDDNKYGYFPSGAFAWRMNEESFIKDLDIFHDLKLRMSYGVTGSQAIDSYATMGLLVTQQDYPISGSVVSVGVAPGVPENRTLKWEETAQSDIGIDMSILKGRLSLTSDVYKKNTTGLLLDVPLPIYTGAGSVTRNVGEIENRGIELNIDAVPFSTSDFNWKSSFNISFNTTEVIDLGGDDHIFGGTYGEGMAVASTFIIQKGEPIGQFWGYDYTGVWKSNEAAEALLFGNVPGDAKYSDINNDKVINSDDLTVIGNGQPDFIWGLHNTLTYRDLELSFFIQGVQGNEVFNFLKGYMFGGNGDARNATTVDILDRWTPQNEDTDVPGFSSTSKNVIQSSRNIEDGSYVKLKNITLGYNLPTSLLSKIKISSARFFVSGQNLLTITNYSGFDPEVSSSGNSDVDLGIDWGAYPNPKTFTVGLNVNF